MICRLVGAFSREGSKSATSTTAALLRRSWYCWTAEEQAHFVEHAHMLLERDRLREMEAASDARAKTSR
jgi:hypothetical protein